MKTARPPTDQIDVHDLRVGMFVHLDIGWMSHPFPLSSFRIATPAQLATIRSLGLRTVRWSPQQSDPAGADTAPATTLPGPLPVRASDAANDSGLGDADAIDTVPYTLPPDDNVVDAADHARQRAQAERQRKLTRQRAADQRCTRQYAEAARTCRQTLELVHAKPHEARAQAEALSRAITGKMIGEQDLCIRMLVEGAGDRASMHAMNVTVISLLMGRCFGFIDEEMQDLGVGAMLHDVGKEETAAAPAPPRGELLAQRVARVPGARRGRARASQAHGPVGGSDSGHRPAPRARRRQRLPGKAQQRPDDDGGAHRRAGQPLRQPLQSAPAGACDDAARVALAAVRAGPQQVRHVDPRRLHQDDGRLSPGSMVQLTDDRYALVVAVNSTRPLKPSVRVHDPATPRDEALVLDLESTAGLGIRRSLRAQQMPPTALEYLQPSTRVTYFFEPSGAADDDE